jgi:hypothetical protein
MVTERIAMKAKNVGEKMLSLEQLIAISDVQNG